jgi:hypothetical protein
VARLRPAVAALVLLTLSAVPARSGFFGRSKMSSSWTGTKVEINGDESEWDEKSAFEEDGLSVFARNDAKDLYLLITAHTRESRDQLSGESHQDLSLWFVAADGKTRKWGARIPFSRRAPLTNALRDPAGLDPEPELVQYQGAEISTGSLPEEILDRLTEVGRRPIWELKIPLQRLEVNAEGVVDIDFILSAPPGGPKRKAVDQSPARTDDPANGGSNGAPGRNGGRGGRGNSASHPEDLVWDASSYTLSLRLARDPSLAH